MTARKPARANTGKAGLYPGTLIRKPERCFLLSRSAELKQTSNLELSLFCCQESWVWKAKDSGSNIKQSDIRKTMDSIRKDKFFVKERNINFILFWHSLHKQPRVDIRSASKSINVLRRLASLFQYWWRDDATCSSVIHLFKLSLRLNKKCFNCLCFMDYPIYKYGIM